METNSLHGSPIEYSPGQVFGLSRKRKRVFSEEERREVSTEVVLIHGTVHGNHKKPIEVSTLLKLFDDSWAWPTPKTKKPNKPDEDSSLVASRIALMKHYGNREEREERMQDVSTKLTLFLDPWKIKKRLTHSDLGHLCRLLVQTTLVEKYIFPFMNPHQMAQIQTGRGTQVLVWDQDTRSEHNLVLKRWATSKSYVFIDGWSQEFVKRRELREGDEIGMYWDPHFSRFNFRVFVRP